MMVYLTEDDRKRLLELRDMIPTSENRDAINKEISEIESRRKPMSECNLNELYDLRNQYTERMMKLMNIGSTTTSYEVAIRSINQRISIVSSKEAMEKTKTPKKVERPTTTNTDNYDWSVEFGKYGK